MRILNTNFNNQIKPLSKINENKKISFSSSSPKDFFHVSSDSECIRGLESLEADCSFLTPYIKKIKLFFDKGYNSYEEGVEKQDKLTFRKANHYYKLARNYINELVFIVNNKQNQEQTPLLKDKLENLQVDCCESQFSCIKNIYKRETSPQALEQSEKFYKGYHKTLAEHNDVFRFDEKFEDGVSIGINQFYDKEGYPVSKKTNEVAYRTLIINTKNDTILRQSIDNLKEKIKLIIQKDKKETYDLDILKEIMSFSDETFPEINKTYKNPRTGNPVDYNTWHRNHEPNRGIYLGEFINGSKNGISKGEGVCQEQAVICKSLAENSGLDFAFVQNKRHSWNEFESKISGKKYLFDPRQRTIADLNNHIVYKFNSETKQFDEYNKDMLFNILNNYTLNGRLKPQQLKNGLKYFPEYDIFVDFNKSKLFLYDIESKELKPVKDIKNWIFQQRITDYYVGTDGFSKIYT